MKIGINCGHTVSGQPGCGAVGFIDESVESRKVGNELMRLFRNEGHTVINCTNDYANSTSENLSKIVSLANAQSLDLFVSIHFNAGGGKGTEVYTWKGEQHSYAKNVCSKLNAIGFKNRGVKDGSGLYVIKHTNATAMLIEICFVDTQSDVNLYKSLGHETIARAIYTGITGKEVGTMSTGQFTDVSTTDPAYEHIKKLKDYGIINGYADGSFKPDQTITRREAAVMVANALTICGK